MSKRNLAAKLAVSAVVCPSVIWSVCTLATHATAHAGEACDAAQSVSAASTDPYLKQISATMPDICASLHEMSR